MKTLFVEKTSKNHWFIPISLALLVLTVYSYRLNFPSEMYYDEVYQVKTAQEMLSLSGYTERAHPPLGMILMATSITLLGDHSISWRLCSLLAGAGIIIVIYVLTKKLTQSIFVAFLASFLYSLNGISMTQARIGMLNAMMLFFMLLSILCLVHYMTDKKVKRSRAFFLSGMFWGLSAATRWVGIWLFGLLGILLVAIVKEEKDKGLFLKEAFVGFCIVPLLFYFLPHLIIPFIDGFSWADIWRFQAYMASYHVALKQGHTYESAWWGWPLLVRPIWYYFQRQADAIYGILCIGNPAIFWGLPFALGTMAWIYWKEKSLVSGFALWGFLSQWLPWSCVERVKFFHYFDTVMPFAVISIAVMLERIWHSPRMGPWVVIGYVTVVIGMFLYWYPLWTGFPISEKYFQHHLWFKSWI